jgi:phosphoglycerol transferase MdoB-like AlkP superfamily enzyme
MDIGWALQNHIELVWALIAVTVVVLALVSIPIPAKPVQVSLAARAGSAFISFTLGFLIVRMIAGTFDPFKQTQRLDALRERIERSAARPPTVNSTDLLIDFLRSPAVTAHVPSPPSKPNLLILELESLENELLGPFNADYPSMLPFLSKYVQQGTHFKNVISQPYTTWSVASLFAVQCNLPLLLHHVQANDQGKFHLTPNLRCLGDFLAAAGYRLLSYQSNVFVGEFKKHMALHHYDSRDYKNHKCRRDWDLFAKLEASVRPELVASATPCVLHVANADCPAIPRYYVDRRCTNRMPGAPAIVRSFDCADQVVERFVRAFEASPLARTTDVLLYGDHVLMEGNYKQITLHEPRSLVLAWPYHEQRTIEREVTVYDIAPTVLRLLGVEYEPPMPFGADLFGNKSGKVPSPEDFQTIYDMFTSEMKWDSNVTCWGGKGFCTVARS